MGADDLVSFLSILLKKHDMAPRRSAKVAGVVVGISRPREPVIRHVIPFFARDFASFAANANGRVSEEADLHIFLHVIVAALVRALVPSPIMILSAVNADWGNSRSFFSFCRVAAAACGCTDHRLFWVQSDWTDLRRVFVEK